jgi:hypothetical protein
MGITQEIVVKGSHRLRAASHISFQNLMKRVEELVMCAHHIFHSLHP